MAVHSNKAPLELPAYPYSRLGDMRDTAASHDGGVIDLSIGTPCDPPSEVVMEALRGSDSLRGYPASIGSSELLSACSGWLEEEFSVSIRPGNLAACIGTKEFVASLPHCLRLRYPDRDTVLYPELSYPTYEMGAILAGCRAVPVKVDDNWRMDLASIADEDRSRSLLLWANSPGNPAGQLDNLENIAIWGRSAEVIIASDECYAGLTWNGPSHSILQAGLEGVLAVHSLSKRSNLAGLRAGFYAGDEDLIGYLSLLRMHAGMMLPGPVQTVAMAAWGDTQHALVQKQTYRDRLEQLASIFKLLGAQVVMPEGGLYLWVKSPEQFNDGWAFAAYLAENIGCLVSPGSLYGHSGNGHVRIAAVQPNDRIDLLERRVVQLVNK